MLSNVTFPSAPSQCRKLMIDVVLATDMAIHFDLLRSFNSAVEAKPDLNEWPERNLIYQMIVHLADIANPSRPFPLARGWAERVIKEFCEQASRSSLIAWHFQSHYPGVPGLQGDKEAAAGLAVSSFCNRSTMNMPRAQLNFIDIFLKVRASAPPQPDNCMLTCCATLPPTLQPTLLSMAPAAPEFTGMALSYLEKTIAEWQALEAQGFLM